MSDGISFLARKLSILPTLESWCPTFDLRLITGLVILSPLIEEVVFRGVLQDQVLKPLSKYLFGKKDPESGASLDTKAATAFRIFLASALFGAAHLTNLGKMPTSYVAEQVFTGTALGAMLGAIQESSLGVM